MPRTKNNKPGLRSQLKRKRELEESGEVNNKPAKRSASKGKSVKRDSASQASDQKPTKRASSAPKSSEPTATDTGPAKASASDDEHTSPPPPKNPTLAQRKKEHSPAPDFVADSSLLADHFAKFIRKSFEDNSAIELEEQYLPAKAFLDTTSYDKDRLAIDLPDFLEKFSAKGKEGLSTSNGEASPHTIVVTSSGMRTADLYRELAVFQNKESKVGKLIAKHMKLKANIKYMQENKIGIAISTPMRFNQLIDAGALKTENLRRIVVDASYRDDKKNTIFMMDQTFQPLITLLNEKTIRQRYGVEVDKTDILVF